VLRYSFQATFGSAESGPWDRYYGGLVLRLTNQKSGYRHPFDAQINRLTNHHAVTASCLPDGMA